MPTCPNCGEENSDRARFCQACATPLAPETPTREVRKTVTVVFCDVTGSTALGEKLDPESLRKVMSRYFEEMKAVLERHGGTVEKFIGDAVMAVFGIPKVHEDDALRAVRAAAEMREALAALNAELERDHGVRIEVRIGVHTGEVVAGDPGLGQRLVTGDVVNTAARLEQAAVPGEILLGDPTFRLVRDAVKVQAVPPVDAKGKAAPVAAHRLEEVLPGAPAFARRLDSPMVGRDRELRLLLEAFDRAASERACLLFTVLGSAGVGKSRLVEEFLGRAADRGRVLRGRCLPYGEGITFWPLAEVVKQAAGITDEEPPQAALEKVARLVGEGDHAETVVQRVGQAIGLVRDSAVPQETLWAVRRLLESLASREPLVVVFDDIHWAEPTFLDLVEHVADWSRDAPILLLSVARPELLDGRPAWGGGKMNAASILLESLSDDDCRLLIGNLLGAAQVPEGLAARITEAAEGNPLFVEEMLAMLIDDDLLRRDDGPWEPAGDLSRVAVPPTIHALLAARLDRLSPEERTVLERAAVEGKVFSLEAVEELCDPAMAAEASAHLMALVRKELVRPHGSELGGDTFRFRHLLIRDAAYEAIPKSERATLHERFADWLERTAAERAREYEEILGYHLEQAYRYRAELGPVDEEGRATGHRAAERLGSAGRRALGRGDAHAAISLLGRAVGLLPPDDPFRLELSPELGLALRDAGELTGAAEVLDRAVEAAEGAGDARAAARARIERRLVQIFRARDLPAMEELIEEVQRDVRLLEEAGDDRGLSRAWALRGMVANMLTDFEGLARYAELAIRHGVRSGGVEIELLVGFGAGLLAGPVPVPEALARLTSIGATIPVGQARDLALMHHRANALKLAGDNAGARDAATRAREMAVELGGGFPLSHAIWESAYVEREFGRLDEAERFYWEAYRQLEAMGERSWRSTLCCDLALLLWELGRDDEALDLAREGRDLAAPDDILTQVMWRDVTARILSRRGDAREAERLVREALALTERMDSPRFRAETLRGLSVVLAAAGRHTEAARALDEAIALLDAKGATNPAARFRDELRALRVPGTD